MSYFEKSVLSDKNGNVVDPSVDQATLEQILLELQKLNTYMALITDVNLKEEDVICK
jgi:hypothetical protein